MEYLYRAKDRRGQQTTGVVEAEGKRAASEIVRQMGFALIDISLVPETGLKAFINKLNPLKPKVKSKDVVVFSRQLSTLVSAGVPLVQGLGILESQAQNPLFKSILEDIKTDIEAGISISNALEKHPTAFTTFYTSMIRSGELGGILDTILERLSNYLERADTLRAKVKSAMMYPVVVSVVALVITVFLMVFVIPTFKSIFSGFGHELPLPTRIVMAISDAIRYNFLVLALGAAGLVFGFKKFAATEKGKWFLDEKILKAPIFGILLKKVAVAKFTRTLGTLLKSGVPVLQGLETVAATADNVVIESVIMSCRDNIREGGLLSQPLKDSDLFPPMVSQMISVGEETGSLDEMLVRIADFYDQEVDTAVKGLTSLIEPLVMVFLGIVIGGIVIAMFLPIMSMGTLVGE